MRKTWYSRTLLCGLLAVTPAPWIPAQPAGAPGSINLDLQGVTVSEALDQLTRQAGVELIIHDGRVSANANPVVIKVQNGRFWPTFIDICRQAGVSIDPIWGGKRPKSVRLVSGTGDVDLTRLPRVESQGFVLVPQSVQRNASISYDRPEHRNSMFYVQMGVLIDPSMDIIQVGQATATEAVDENGLSLLPLNRNMGEMSFANRPDSLIHKAAVSLGYPPNAGKRIAHVKGTLSVRETIRTEIVEIESPLTAKVFTGQFHDFDLTIHPLKQMPKDEANPAASIQYQLRMVFKARDSQGAGPRRSRSRSYWPMISTIVLTDAEGHRLGTNGGGGSGSADVMECTATFHAYPGTGVGQPAKLTWKVPVETREISIPFELKDLAIP